MIIPERGDWLRQLRAHIRFKRERPTRDRDLGTLDTMLRATRRLTRRIKVVLTLKHCG